MYLEEEPLAANGFPVSNDTPDTRHPKPETRTITGRHRVHPHLVARLGGVSQGVDLMQTVFADGRRTAPSPPVHDIRKHALDQIAALPEEFKRLRNPEVYRVLLSEAMGRLKEEMLENPGVR
jgi:nicotinate phosphoribosyltransferase